MELISTSDDSQLDSAVEANTPGTSFPATSLEAPVIMFAKNNNSVKFGDERWDNFKNIG